MSCFQGWILNFNLKFCFLPFDFEILYNRLTPESPRVILLIHSLYLTFSKRKEARRLQKSFVPVKGVPEELYYTSGRPRVFHL